MRKGTWAAGLVGLGLLVATTAAPAAASSKHSFVAEGPWRSSDGLLSGTWRAQFDIAGFDLSGTLDIIGMPNVARGNIAGSWDLQNVGFGVMFTDQELISFTGGLDGDRFVGTFETGEIEGIWEGLLDRLSLTTQPIIPVLDTTLPTLLLSRIDGALGDIVNLGATLYTLGQPLAELTNTMNFDPIATQILAKANGKPNCKVNPLIDKADTIFEFLPQGCSGTACNQVRVLVQSLSNLAELPDGAMLYTCKVKIGAQAAGGIHQIVATALSAIDTDSILHQITSLAGEIMVKLKKHGCDCATVDTAGTPPLWSLLAPFALIALRRRAQRRAMHN